jgi:hypothetical protein
MFSMDPEILDRDGHTCMYIHIFKNVLEILGT